MLELLCFHCPEIGRTLLRGGYVVCSTEQAAFCAFTAIGGVKTTASPATVFAVAGDVPVTEQKAAGAAQDRECVGPNMVNSTAYCYPLRKGPPELKANSHVCHSLPIPLKRWQAENVYHLRGMVVKYSKFFSNVSVRHVRVYWVNPTEVVSRVVICGQPTLDGPLPQLCN